MKKALRIIGVVAVIVVLIAAIVASMNQGNGSNAEKVWDADMTVGNMDAKNYFIIYSDLACPYCVAFENAILENEENFKRYIEANDILVEVRLSDFLYEYGQSQSIESLYGAEGAYCAKKEGKFWEYYNASIKKVWKEFFETSGKGAFTEFNKLGEDYWIKIGEKVGLSDDFASCMKNNEMLPEIMEASAKSAKLISGMPYFKFNKYVSSGFDLTWGYEYVLMYFEAGLGKK